MKLGSVIALVRQDKHYSQETMADVLKLDLKEYALIESNDSPVDQWVEILVALAVKLECPMSRLISQNGRPRQTNEDRCGRLIGLRRREVGLETARLAGESNIGHEILLDIERGTSHIEEYGPMLLRLAQIVEQPVFNIVCPCGIPLRELQAHPLFPSATVDDAQ